MVRKTEPFSATRECIVVLRTVFPGLVTALHIKLDHPTPHQLKQVLRCYFFALDLDCQVDQVYTSCHHCAPLHSFPKPLIEQSASETPPAVGTYFAADVVHRERQFIFILREYVTSYTQALLIEGEDHAILHDGLIQLCLAFQPLEGPPAVIRVDPAPGFQSLIDDVILHKYQLPLEIGRKKNINENPVAERAAQELETELLHQDPSGGGPVSPLTLSISISHLNSHLRSRGLSAREMFQRDQYNNNQITVNDSQLLNVSF